MSTVPHRSQHHGWSSHVLLEDRRKLSTHLSSISNTFFVTLLNRLGVRPPPADGFDLINVVQPVTLVDSDIVLPVQHSTQLLDLPFTAGELTAPAINTVLADTGPQISGNYQVLIFVNFFDSAAAAIPIVSLARRNAANAADIWAQNIYGNSSVAAPAGFNLTYQFRLVLQTSERLRLTNLVAGGALQKYHANIWLIAG